MTLEGKRLKMFQVAICDNDKQFGVNEKNLVERYFLKKEIPCVVDVFSSGRELLKLKNDILKYDMIFIDVNMDGTEGISVARKLRQLSSELYIIFVTSQMNHAVDGYKINAFRYLLKDGDFEQGLEECLHTVVHQMKAYEAKFEYDFQGGKISLSVDKILYVESRLHKVIFHVMENTGKIQECYKYDKLDIIEEQLKQYDFCRIHQSYLINLHYLESVERYKVTLSQGAELSISKKYYKTIEEIHMKLKGSF